MLRNTKNIFWVHICVLWSSFPLHWKPNIFLVNYDSWWQHIKCRGANSGMTGQVGRFQNPGFVCKRFLPFFPTRHPALLLTPFFTRSLTLVPLSLLLNRTATLAMQASMIVLVIVVLNNTVVDSDWRSDNLCGSHLQSQSELNHVTWWYSTLVISDLMRCYWSAAS